MTTATESKNPKIAIEQPNQDSPLDQNPMSINGDFPLSDSVVSPPLTLAAETATEGKQATESKGTTMNSSVPPSSFNNFMKGAMGIDIQKKVLRAERFGVPVQLSEQEKRNTRAERFGTASTKSVSVKDSEEQKWKSRRERFGTSGSAFADDEAKKKARLARFASASSTTTTEEEEKRNARAIRFSQPTGSIFQVNGKGDMKVKTDIPSNVGTGT